MIITPSLQTYLDAKSLLLAGDLVAFPTETVYGLWANALDPLAVAKIFQTKGRPQKNPIIVHLGSADQISTYAEITSPLEQLIIDHLMPGPITLLLKKKDNLPDIVTAGSEFVGIRIPANEVALSLLQTSQLPLAAPSANISTKPSPTTAAMVRDNFQEKVPMIIDGGACEVGIESTVVKVEGDRIIITRPGFITQEDIQSLVPAHVQVDYAQKVSEITPGNMFKHYSPHAKVHIISDPSQIPLPSERTEIEVSPKRGDLEGSLIALIATQERLETHHAILQSYQDQIQIFPWWSQKNLISCAKNVFSLYHECDKLQIDHIYIEALPEVGLGYAIMNRVKKSAE